MTTDDAGFGIFRVPADGAPIAATQDALDVSEYTARSSAFRDYVYETNLGRRVWFVADDAELEQRLQAHA